jgi:hypothetical protein
MDLDPTFCEFVQTLSSRRVRYLVVGGYAVAAHGQPRYTEDFDVWVEPTLPNARRVARALADFGFPAYLEHTEELATLDRMTHIGVPPLRIDLMTSITGVASFRAAWARRIVVHLFGIDVPFLGLETLLANKRASGRARDQADLLLLEPPRTRRPRPPKRRP